MKHLQRKLFLFNATIIRFFVTVFFFCKVGFVFGQSSADTKSLLKYLFIKNQYNKDVRPSINQSEKTDMYIDLSLIAFDSLDEVQQKLKITAVLSMFWYDEHLTWKPASYGGITQLYIPQNKIWKPDIGLLNGSGKLKELGNSFILTRVTNDGFVSWMPYEVFEINCDMDISDYPFDEQKCGLKFVVWTHSISEVFLTLGDRDIMLHITSNGEWDIVETSKSTTVEALEATVTFSLTFRRKPLYVMLNMILPIIFLSVLNNAVFILPADSGEKMGYSVTVFLSFAVYMTIVATSLPETSTTIPLLSLYLLLQLSVGTMTVLITSIQLRLHFREHEIPMGFKLLAKFADLLMCRKKCCKKIRVTLKNGNSVEEISRKESDKCNDKVDKCDKVTWKDVCSAIDVIMFWLLTLFLIVNTTITFSIAYTKRH